MVWCRNGQDLASLDDELLSKGITTISPIEPFQAWEHVNKYDVDGPVVTRVSPIEEGDVFAVSFFEEVVSTRPRPQVRDPPPSMVYEGDKPSGELLSCSRYKEKSDRQTGLSAKIRQCIASVLMLSD